jgi:hypothetical protein
VRLHIDVIAAKELFRPVARQVLHHIGVLAPAVVAPPRIALGVFIGEDGAGRLQHRFGNKVFAGNHLQPLVLAESFLVKGSSHIGVGLGESERNAVGHRKILAFSFERCIPSQPPQPE